MKLTNPSKCQNENEQVAAIPRKFSKMFNMGSLMMAAVKFEQIIQKTNILLISNIDPTLVVFLNEKSVYVCKNRMIITVLKILLFRKMFLNEIFY